MWKQEQLGGISDEESPSPRMSHATAVVSGIDDQESLIVHGGYHVRSGPVDERHIELFDDAWMLSLSGGNNPTPVSVAQRASRRSGPERMLTIG